jgi:CheY-like chemotaxis protein
MSSFDGHTILIVEDESLVALDICQSFEDAGARVIPVRTRAEALEAVTSTDVSRPL